MKNILKEEINQIKYLFNYDRGKILSEQIDPEKKKEYLKKMEIAKGKNYMYETLYFDYLSQEKDVTALNNRIDQKKIEEINNEYIKSNPTNTQTADTPTLPKAEPTTNLGNVPNETWEEMQETAKTKPNYYTGVGESTDRETAKKNARSNAEDNAKKKLNKTELTLKPGPILINGLLSQKSDDSYIYRALYYITPPA